MNFKLFFITIVIVFSSCVKSDNTKNKPEAIIPIDITKAAIFDLNDFDKEPINIIRYVPLETTDSSLIGAMEKIFLYKDDIIIFDSKPNKILLFKQNGRFVRQIGSRGGGPDEYIRINDVFFEKSSGLIYAHERLKNVVYVYNLDGEIINKIKPFFSFNSFCKTEEGFWLYTCFENHNPNGYNLMLVDNSMQRMIRGYFPQNPKFINVEFMSRFRFDSEGTAYFTYPTSNCIYKLSGQEPEIFYKIDFGNKTAPYEQIAKIETHDEYNKLLENDFFMLGNYYIWNNILIFYFSESSLYKPHTIYSAFYNNEDSKLNIYKGFIRSLKIPSTTITWVSGSSLVWSVNPYELEKDYLEYLEKQVNVKLNDESNPVLVIVTPKTKISEQ